MMEYSSKIQAPPVPPTIAEQKNPTLMIKKKREEMTAKMGDIVLLLMKKTESRMRRETRLSKKTLKMVSQTEKLFAVFCNWSLP